MKIINDFGNGLFIIEPTIYSDDRGYFYESFNEKDFKKHVADIIFVQENQSKSQKGVLRGMHFQNGEHAQSKLVRVVKGAVVDVVVDLRDDSPTYNEVFSVLLSEDNHRQFFIPKGFAHGFVSLCHDTVFQYKCDNFYNKESEGHLNYQKINFDWDEIKTRFGISEFILSEKDKLD